MSEIYEQLEKLVNELGDEGLNTMALMSLPGPARVVVRLILRNKGDMSYAAMLEAMESQPEKSRLSQAELDDVLDAMTRLDLIVYYEEKGEPAYKLDLGPSTSGTRGQSRTENERAREARKRADEVWDKMDDVQQEEGGLFKRLFGGRDE